MKQIIAIIIAAISLVSVSNAENIFIPLSQEQETKSNTPIRFVESDEEGVTVEYIFPGAFLAESEVQEETFDFIHVPGFSKMMIPGHPAVPANNDFVAIPENVIPVIEILEEESIEYHGLNIAPATEPALDTEGAPEPKLIRDEEIYNSDDFFPLEIVSVQDIQKQRGQRLALIQIRQAQYNPMQRSVKLYTRVVYRINFRRADLGANYNDLPMHHSDASNNMIKRLVINPQDINDGKDMPIKLKGTQVQTANTSKDYIIVTHSDFIQAANKFASWKRQLGFKVEVVAQSSWTSGQVDTVIKDRYENWTPKPDYFLIIGDHEQVPGKVQTNISTHATDLYYACMDGSTDYQPEMAHGRLSVTSLTMANTVVDKIINYEMNPPQDSAFYENGVNCSYFQHASGGYAQRRFNHTSEDIKAYVESQGYDVERISYTESSVTPTNYNNGYYSDGQAIPSEILRSNGFAWNGGSTSITNAINEGRFYVFHRDHGYSGGSGWSKPYYTKTSMNSLSNDTLLPVVFSINCHTGEFTIDECFAEKFQRMEDAGAVGVIGASNFSYSGFNDALVMGMFDGIWSNPGLVPDFGSGGVVNPTISSHSDITRMGDVMNHGLTRMQATWAGSVYYHTYQWELYHYFGDPAMRMWTSYPENITLSHADTINSGSTSFEITNCSVADAVVTLSTADEMVGTVTLSNGNGTISMSPLSVSADSLTLTVHARDHKPFITTIEVTNNTTAPGHDDPEGAQVLYIISETYNSTVSSTTRATTSMGMAEPTVGDTLKNDVWFMFLVPETGHLVVETSSETGDDITDGNLAIYSGNTDELLLVAETSNNGNDLMPKVALYNRTEGDTLYARFWSNDTNEGNFHIGAYELNASSDILVNLESYSFSQTTTSYQPLSNATVSTASGTSGSEDINLPFTFVYAGNEYTTARISVNGSLQLGATATVSNTNSLSSTENVIAAIWDDLNVDTGSEIRYNTSGTAPNRTFSVEWSGVSYTYSASSVFNFKINLKENSNNIELEYGTFSNIPSMSASVGITGTSSSFISLVPYPSPVTSDQTAYNTLSSFNLSYAQNRKYILSPIVQAGIDMTGHPSPLCTGTSAGNVSFVASGTFETDNYFIVQLSDSTGDFTNNRIVGSVESTTSTSIAITLPIDVPAGNAYRLRVISTNPYTVSEDNGTDLTVSCTCEDLLMYSTKVKGGRSKKHDAAADIVIAEGNRVYEIENNANVEFNAGTSIVFKPGFHAKDGSRMKAKPQNSCSSPSMAYIKAAEKEEIVEETENTFEKEIEVKVYPNPTTDYITVDFREKADKITVVDLMGNTQYSAQVQNNRISINMTNYTAGMYLLKIQHNNSTHTVPVVKN